MPIDLDVASKAIIDAYRTDDVKTVGLSVGRAMVLAREDFHKHEVAKKFAVPAVFDRSKELLASESSSMVHWAARMLRFLIVDGQINTVANYPGLARKVLEARYHAVSADLKDYLDRTYTDMQQEREFPDPNILFFKRADNAEPPRTAEKAVILPFEQRFGRALNEIWNRLFYLNPELRNPDYRSGAYLQALDDLRNALRVKSEIVVPVRPGKASDFVLPKMEPDVVEAIEDYSYAKSASMFAVETTARLINPDTPVRVIMDGITRDTFPAGKAPHNGRREFVVREALLDRGSLCPWADTNSSPIASFMADLVGVREVKIIANAGREHLQKNDPAGFLRYMADQYPSIISHVHRAFGEVAVRHQATLSRDMQVATDWDAGIRVLRAAHGEHCRLN